MALYYDDLSADSSSDDDSSSSGLSQEDGADHHWKDGESYKNANYLLRNNIWSRCILHLDIDCFYCQCEEIDRNLRQVQPPRPLAIGQKHIIVTCNYEARKYGVKKLQLREAAMAACPDLWIVEGSDLLKYKRHSRAVYESFRHVLKEIAAELGIDIAVKKGTMDEMMADLSQAVDRLMLHSRNSGAITKDETYHSTFVFGENAAPTKLVEDQTGQETLVGSKTVQAMNLPHSRRNVHETYATEQDRQLCIRRLDVASKLVSRVCGFIFQNTGFYCTGGISVSPLLAKIASDLNKPRSINLLYPWRSSHLLYSMPLRKMPNIGSRTMRALEPSLEKFAPSQDSPLFSDSNKQTNVKTVLDLLKVPHELIAKSLKGLQSSQGTSSEQCDLIVQRCRGLDTSQIIDDGGELPKTVSVENSFKRGTVCTMAGVWQALEDLLQRLPLLLNDRTSWAVDPEQAFPTTIRLTVRMVDRCLVSHKRRPFVTQSKQSPMTTTGKTLVQEQDVKQQSVILQRLVTPLLDQLIPATKKDINLTRLNIAVTNFQDVKTNETKVECSGQSLLPSRVQKHQIISNDTPTQKKARTEGGFSYSQATTTSSSHRVSALLSQNSSSSKMKPTRIDNFFQRKKAK